jgi:hypothetical protein
MKNTGKNKETQGKRKFDQFIEDLMDNVHFQADVNAWAKETDEVKKNKILKKIEVEYGVTQDELPALTISYDKKDVFITPKSSLDMVQIECDYDFVIDGHIIKTELKPDQPDSAFPVGLRINRNASKRDVLDFIEKNWSNVENLLKKSTDYKKRNIRTRKYDDRDKFIIEQSNEKTANEIVRMVNDNDLFGSKQNLANYEQVNKIRSLRRKKKRKKL